MLAAHAFDDFGETKDYRMTDTTPVRRHTISPLLLVVAVPLAMLILMVGVLMLAQRYVTPQGLSEYECEMPDGSILKIEALTWGTAHHITYQRPSAGFSWMMGVGSAMLNANTSRNQVMVWMTRRHGQTGQPLDLEFWYENVVTDAFDDEISDRSAQNYYTTLHQLSAHGQSTSSTAERPLKCDRSMYSSWVVASPLPPFRPKDDRLRLRVKNTEGKVVAEFNLAHPSPTPYPVWTAEALPKTFVSGDLEVTLNSIQSGGHEYLSNHQVVTSYWASTNAEFKWQGQPTKEWQQWASFTSPLGVGLGSEGVGPTDKEKVWQMQMTCTKLPNATFTEQERGSIKAIELQEAAKSSNVELSTPIDGGTLQVLTVAGAGKITFDLPSSRLAFGSGRYSSGHGHFAFQKNVHWQFEGQAGGNSQITVDSPLPWILIDRGSGAGMKQFHFAVTDDQGREVKSEMQYLQNTLSVVYLQPAQDTKSVNLEIKAHTPIVFTANVELPEPKIQKLQQ